ncbi:uncharacterized protein LOC122060441 [Macadamia integrifolia]|uniref:uncharacterized protein LOC122060441 n=1 Tax=Macadamia integrifolia TaxID=60698 RepID=UPI001C4F206B|nr:uncharacterized protein LOC122060441 [Macadamia integrifolia]
MLLRNSIAKTKRFFQRTVESFKSLLSGGYEKLPKTPTCNTCSCTGGVNVHSHRSFGEMDNFYGDFVANRWDSSDPERGKQQPIGQEEIYGGSFLKFEKQSPVKIRNEERRRETGKEIRRVDSRKSHGGGGGEMGFQSLSESNVKEGEGYLVVVQKLKELEMMDASDIEHVLDIEEVIHYYSRLTCPAYLDIVNRFFMEMYSDFFLPHPPSSSSSSVNNHHSRRPKF